MLDGSGGGCKGRGGIEEGARGASVFPFADEACGFEAIDGGHEEVHEG